MSHAKRVSTRLAFADAAKVAAGGIASALVGACVAATMIASMVAIVVIEISWPALLVFVGFLLGRNFQ